LTKWLGGPDLARGRSFKTPGLDEKRTEKGTAEQASLYFVSYNFSTNEV